MGLETARTAQQLAEEQRVEAAQDGGQRLLLQKRHGDRSWLRLRRAAAPAAPPVRIHTIFFSHSVSVLRDSSWSARYARGKPHNRLSHNSPCAWHHTLRTLHRQLSSPEVGEQSDTTRLLSQSLPGIYLQGLEPALHGLLLARGLPVLGRQERLGSAGARQAVPEGRLQQHAAPKLAQQLLKHVALQLAQRGDQHLNRQEPLTRQHAS